MNPHEFLDVAGEWAAGPREAEWRSAVSRAYYAAFHVARDLLLDCGFVVSTGEQAHAYLWLRLANSSQPDVQRAGNDLNTLRGRRNRADYDLDVALSQESAMDYVQFALDIVQILDAITTAPNIRTRITDAIKIYERDVLKDVTWHA